jgi:preprotein translocase subunit YajC
MGNAAWVRQVMRGTTITTETGERATITDIGNTGATIQPDGDGEALNIAMRDIRTTISLWVRLHVPPSASQVREAGVPEAYAAYLIPLIVAVRRAPGVKEWVQAERTDRRVDVEGEQRER